MCEYKIRMIGEYDMVVLTPKMIALLIERLRNSDQKELVIPAGEILPQGYAEYLIRILETNTETKTPNIYPQKIYELLAGQIKKLYIDCQKCFDSVSLYEHWHHTHFNLNASEIFYMLVKQRIPHITYVYMDTDETEIQVTLLCPPSSNNKTHKPEQ